MANNSGNCLAPISGFTFLRHKFTVNTQKDLDAVEETSGEVLLTDYQKYVSTKCAKFNKEPNPLESYLNFSTLMKAIRDCDYIGDGFNYAGENETADIVGHIQKSQTKDLGQSSKTVFGVDIWNLTDHHLVGVDLYVHTGYPYPLVVWDTRKPGQNSYQAVPIGNLAKFVVMPFSVERLFFRKADYATSGTSGVMRFRLTKGLSDKLYHKASPFIMWDLPHSGRLLHGSRNEFAVGFDCVRASDYQQFSALHSCKSPRGEYFSKKVASRKDEEGVRISWPPEYKEGEYQIEMLPGAGQHVASIVTIHQM